ncbi:MAG: DUF3048 domain-containing protein [Microgenomates group bacterium]
MINKKLAYFILLIVFLLSTYTSYSYFHYKPEGLLSPIPFNNQSLIKNEDKNQNSNGNTFSNEPLTEECPLNGELLTKTQREKWEKRRPLGIMIENHKDARPQSGLQSADVIYEAVAEGGITRFLAVFYCKDAKYVGPIRSARIYFIKILEGYGNYPLYAHVGGANTPGPADALGYLKQLGWASYNDLNQFSVPFPYFWRDYERLPNRATEHTVYSSTTKLWQYAKEKRGLSNIDEDQVPWNKNFKSWIFKDDALIDKRGDVNKINFGFWNILADDYSVTWDYIRGRNSYLRTNGSQPHIDKNTNKPIEAKNVVIIFAKESPANDGYPGGHILYELTGQGKTLVFQDGKVIEGYWARKKDEELLRFYIENDKEIPLVRGLTFVEILPTGNKVNY